MTGVLYGLAQFCVRRRYYVLIVWLIVTVVLVVVSHRLGDNTNDNLSLPGTDSQRATNVLAKSFPDQSNGSSPIVMHAASGQLTDAKHKQAVEAAAAGVAKEPHVASVVSPLTPQGTAALSRDQATGYLSVTLSVSPGSLSREDAQKIIDGADPAKEAGLEVETGGQLGQKVSKPATESSELIGIVAAMVILTLTFGTVVSMLLPILNAIFGLLATLAIIRILGHAATVPTVAPTLATMIGLGVGIDYALFIVTRHFRGIKDGLSIDESIARAAATSGGAVFFAGGTVTIALVSLAVAGIPLITTLGLMAAIAVVVAVLAALTLLPATLALTGPRINSLRVRHPPTDAQAREGLWAKWANEIARFRWAAGLAALAILIPLTIPLLSLSLGQQDVAALSSSTTARKAYDLLAKNFGAGINGPLIVAVSLGTPAQAPTGAGKSSTSGTSTTSGTSSKSGTSTKSSSSGASSQSQAQSDPRAGDPRLQTLQKDISATSGVVAVTPVQIDKGGTSAFFNAISANGPAVEATSQLVEKLRTTVIPGAEKGTDMRADVGGSTAGYIDLASRISKKLPLQILVVIALSFVLLILAFRTAIIPAQAAVMNLLSITAAYGVLVMITQHGWLSGLFGFPERMPVTTWVPVFLFVILFGLSMDYEVFLLSKIREEYDRLGDNALAVGRGLAATARVISAAAAIMVVVFLSFVLTPDVSVKQIGLGLAAAVLVDATVVRLVLVPAVMELLGKANWWLPGWLDRLLPSQPAQVIEPARAPAEVH